MMLQDRPATEWLRWGERYEQSGVDSLWVADHVAAAPRPDHEWYDGWALLSALAVRTDRCRIGPLVAQFVSHSPLELARLAVTVDTLSQGRLDLGLGYGGAPIERSVAGTPDATPTELA